mmetsp:Transcript_18450/g.40058  ORF Transcript_18450/g.40058 Transcript_18450/m.40058 type:complete len:118 (+) Transcript_18450:329-682(+)
MVSPPMNGWENGSGKKKKPVKKRKGSKSSRDAPALNVEETLRELAEVADSSAHLSASLQLWTPQMPPGLVAGPPPPLMALAPGLPPPTPPMVMASMIPSEATMPVTMETLAWDMAGP